MKHIKTYLVLLAALLALTVFGTAVSAASTETAGQLCGRGLAAGCTAAQRGLQNFRNCRANGAGNADAPCVTGECPNGNTPAQDGTGYRGGRNEDAPCVTGECPNGGTPAQDGTGYRGGRNEDAPCVTGECPNGNTPAQDGTGYRGGRRGNRRA